MRTMEETSSFSRTLLTLSKLPGTVGHQLHAHSGYVFFFFYHLSECILFHHYVQNEQDISWSHLVTLYERDSGKASGLAMVHKLKYEHIHLTSFSRMRVDLAAQVQNNVSF